MTDILDLPNWKVLTCRNDGGTYTIEAEYTQPLQACTKCGVVGKLYRHGPKVATYRDSPIRGAHVKLVAKVQRYKCRECGGTSLQPLEGVELDRRMTRRCVEYIKTQCLRDTFTRLSEHIGCDEKTIRNDASATSATSVQLHTRWSWKTVSTGHSFTHSYPNSLNLPGLRILQERKQN